MREHEMVQLCICSTRRKDTLNPEEFTPGSSLSFDLDVKFRHNFRLAFHMIHQINLHYLCFPRFVTIKHTAQWQKWRFILQESNTTDRSPRVNISNK